MDSDNPTKPDTNDKPNQSTPTVKESILDNNPTTDSNTNHRKVNKENILDSKGTHEDNEDDTDDDDILYAHLLRTPFTPGAGPGHETASSGFDNIPTNNFTQLLYDPSPPAPPTLSRARLHDISSKIIRGES